MLAPESDLGLRILGPARAGEGANCTVLVTLTISLGWYSVTVFALSCLVVGVARARPNCTV